MAIQSGQVLKQVSAGISAGRIEPKQTGIIQTGRVVRGISSYDERIRQGIISDIEAQKETIRQQNLEIEQQNALLKSAYDKAVSDIKDMNVGDYTTYYYTIPNSIRDLFQTPEQLTKQLAEEKVQRATDTLAKIDERIKYYQDRYNYYDDKYQHTSDPEAAAEYDLKRVSAIYYVQTLNESKDYATGDYTKDDVINYAYTKAQAMEQHNEASVQFDKENAINEAKQIAEYKKAGYEPVYKYPNTQLQQLIGSTETIKDTSSFYNPVITSTSKIIPQSKISLGLSQQQIKSGDKLNILGEQTISEEYYVNQFGQKVSYQPHFQYPYKKEEPKKDLFFKTTPFSKYDNPLAQTSFQTRQPLYKLKDNIKILDIPISQQRGTIGAPTTKIIKEFKIQPIEEDIIGAIEGFGRGVQKGAEDFITIGLGQKLNQDIYFNLPQQTRGTSILNPSTLKFEVPKIETQKLTVPTIFGAGAKVIGIAPELAAWVYAAPVIAVPYAIRGTKTLLNPSLTPMQRLGGGLESGTSLAFGYGGKIAKLIPKELKPSISRTISVTEKLKVPKQEAVLGVSQVNPVEIYEDVLSRQATKYSYKVGTIIPEVAESTGQVTRMYKQNILRDMFGLEPKLVYSGVPYTDKIAYNEAIKQLKLTGLTEKQAKAQIRFTAPKYAESKVNGEAYAIFGEDIKPITFLKAEQKVTPKIIEIKGIKTRSFQPLDYFIKSKGVEAGAKKDIMFFKSLPEYTKTYMTKQGNIFSKLKQAGKTTEVFEQITGIKSLGEREFKATVSDIGYARTYVPKELEAFKDVSISRKIIPKERKLTYGKSNVLTSNIEEPIIVSYEAPFKVTKEIKTGDITGLGLKKGELTEQQKYIKNLGREGTVTELVQKPLSIVKEAKSNLMKEQQRVSGELLKAQVPQVPLNIKNVKIPKELRQNIFKPIPKEVVGVSKGLGNNMFQDLTGMGKIKEDLTGTKFGDLGVMGGRFEGLSLEPVVKEDTKTKVKVIDLYKTKDYFKDLGKVKEPQKEKGQIRFRQPQQPKFKEKQQFKQKQEFKYKIDTWTGTGGGTGTRTEIITDKGKPRPKPEFFGKPPTKKQAEVLSKAFTVLIRSKGKVLEIGKGLPYSKALKLGVEKSKSSLAQTFALRESGTTRGTDISYRVPANLFAQPKRKKTYITPETWTERRGKTLTHYPEIKGLQQARRVKSKQLKWL